MNTGSRRWIAYAVVINPPTIERYQNWIGMWLARRRSEEIHCTMKRAPKMNWPRKPIKTQVSQLNMLVAGLLGYLVAGPRVATGQLWVLSQRSAPLIRPSGTFSRREKDLD